MRTLANKAYKAYFKMRRKRLENLQQNPIEVQEKVLASILKSQRNTLWGKRHRLSSISSRQDFANSSEIQNYKTLFPFIERMMMGEPDVLTKGVVRWFSKSSGTTTGKSKFIPVTRQNLLKNHLRGAWDTMSFLYQRYPESTIFEGRNLIMGGSFSSYEKHPYTKIGDVSAIMLHHTPLIIQPFCSPDFRTALLPDFEEKLERMVDICLTKDIRMIGGVPTWTLVLFRKMMEATGKSNMLEIWPNLECYIHGGVNFEPYRHQFEELLPSDDFHYLEIYNASEGYFAAQNDEDNGLLLLFDNEIYYEFLPVEEWHKPNGKTVTLEEVEIGKNYAIVITNGSGLWRYTPGDTISFTSTFPHKIHVVGRMSHFINAFGEEVVVSNTDHALAVTCEKLDCIVDEYSVAPIFMGSRKRGSHEWFVEFEKEPKCLEEFADRLDQQLQEINSDYEAKRYKDMALERLRVHVMPCGTFLDWLKSKGKFGAQNKVPRLSNNRKIANELLDMLGEQVYTQQ